MDTTDPFPQPSGESYPPLFTPLASNSSSGNSSAQASGNDAPSPQHSSSTTLIFSFLIVFLALFGGFLVGGMAWQRWTLARRRRRRAGTRQAEEARIRRRRPRLWDVYADVEWPKAQRSSWADIHPLSVTLQRNNTLVSESGAQNPQPQPESGPKMQTLWRRNIWQIPADPRTDSIEQALSLQPQLREVAQVAVLVLMPSQYPYTPDMSEITSSTLSGKSPGELSSEYAIGTTLASYDTLDSDAVSP
ncbi:hypothetical protein CERSUDRAFT_116350 [Gelatoporia subvermispora B]|uniref:Uncharacterized protein n=1 Tax=Ceriporiopsis subvermispora (strain B) TaxID=914234 RepID=M2QU75_CERS8|nr:hypothetical protein CERSUDRAFT_116350 [Gelatoporia subvermispora B]